MRRVFLLAMMLSALLHGVVRAQAVRVTLPVAEAGAAARPERYEMLRLTLDVPAGGREVFVQNAAGEDATGGVAFGRFVEAGTARQVLLPLPLVGISEMPEGVWPVRVTLRPPSAIGAGESMVVEVPRPLAAAGDVRRVAISESVALAGVREVLTPWAGEGGVALVRLTDEELQASPALVLAGVDGLYVSPGVARGMSEARALELLACGVSLVTRGDAIGAPPSIGALRWHRPGGGGELWVIDGGGPLPVLERTLDRVLEVAQVGEPPRGMISAAVWVIAGAIVLSLLLRVMLPGRTGLTIALAIAMPLLGLGGVLLIESRAEVREVSVGWAMRTPGDAGALQIEERFAVRAAPVRTPVNIPARAAAGALPVARWPREWHASDAHLLLDSLSETSGARLQQLTMTLPSRTPQMLFTRVASVVEGMETGPSEDAIADWARAEKLELSGGVIVTAGYVRPLRDPGDAAPVVFTSWARTLDPQSQRHLLAWYELRFRASERYLVLPEGRATSGEMRPLILRLPAS